MGTDVTEASKKLPLPCDIKVHSIMCTELIKLVDRVDEIFPEIEAAKPKCSSGLDSLCSIIRVIDTAKLLIQDCCESSKLYLALKGNTVLSRCKKSKNLLEQSLSHIQNMFPVMLESKISQIIGELRVAKFSLNPLEEEAGKTVRSLLDGYRTGNHSETEFENERIQIAAQKLQMTSSKALLIEKRSIKKLIGQVDEGNNKQKKQTLSILLHLLKKYGKTINNVENQDYKSQTVDFNVDREKDMSGTPSEEFKCSISQKLISDHHNDVNPWEDSNDANTWEDSSVNSLSSMYSLQLSVAYSSLSLSSLGNSSVDEDTRGFGDDIDDALPWELQCMFVEDLMTRLKNDDWACKEISCENLVGSLVRFLMRALNINDVKAQRTGCLLLLVLVTKCRGIKYLTNDAYPLIAEFLESEVIEEALAITEELSSRQNCRYEIASSDIFTNIFKILDTRITEIQKPALKILYNLTSTRNTRSLIVSSDLIPKLVTLSEDDHSLSRYCIAILTNLCGNQDDKNIIAETDGCIEFVAKVLDSDDSEEQEHALEILLSVCTQSIQYCRRLVMDEGVIPSLALISSNGNDKGKAKARQMLRLLEDAKI